MSNDKAPAKGAHGEPWEAQDARPRNKETRAQWYMVSGRKRACACVNALDGHDPSAVAALLAACDAYFTAEKTAPEMTNLRWTEIVNAVNALGGAS